MSNKKNNNSKQITTAPQVGSAYLFHTVLGIWAGRVVAVGNSHVVLDQCSWIPDQGRMGASVRQGTYEEAEFVGDGVLIPMDAIIIPWPHSLPTGDK